jgi:alpha-ketoglutarate-dependent taurine dioxygenase
MVTIHHLQRDVRRGFDAGLDVRTSVVEVERCSALSRRERSSIRRALDEFGLVILQLQSPVRQHRDELLSLTNLFGTAKRHARSDPDGIAPIEPSSRHSGYMGSSAEAHPFHTDGAYDDDPPKLVSLHCVRPARIGGVTQLASAKTLYDWLQFARPDLLPSLFMPDALTVERQGEMSTQPILWHEGDRICMRYRADATSRFGCREAAEGSAMLQRLLSARGTSLEFTLSAGQILVIDNTAVLHGRTAFPPTEPRKLNRLTFSGDSEFAATLTFGFKPEAAA